MGLALYEIEKGLYEITARIIDNGGEFTEEDVVALELGQEQLEQKAVAYGYVILNAESETTAIDNEIERLEKLKKARKKTSEFLRGAISTAMQQYGIKEAKTATIKLSFRASTAVVITDETAIPAGYIRTVTTESIDKAQIGRDLKAGIPVSGAELEMRQNLQVK